MASSVGSILRSAHRERFNVLTFPTHERTQSNMARVNADFYMFRSPRVKDWNWQYAPLPSNHHLLDPARGQDQFPPDLEFDLVLSQNRFGQFQLAQAFARRFQVPLLTLEHTWPHPSWGPEHFTQIRRMRGDVDAFISEASRKAWGWDEGAVIIRHGVNTDTFCPAPYVGKKKHVLSVVNQFKTQERRWCCGYDIWEEATRGLPRLHVGECPMGWSAPAKSVAELVMRYREASVFINTTTHSPIPTVLLEGMACGLPVVSTDNCMIPEVIDHGVDGFLSNDPGELRGYCELLLGDEELAKKMGAAARRKIIERFSLDRFVADWDGLLQRTVDARG